jgi:hypothetical protein
MLPFSAACQEFPACQLRPGTVRCGPGLAVGLRVAARTSLHVPRLRCHEVSSCQPSGPIGALLQSCSVLLCLTLSPAGNGEGLGTLGLHQPKLRELATEAGFSSVRRVPMDNPFNNLYQLTP